MAFRDLVRNHLYGKPGKRDFTAADLPGNRVALFGHVLNIRLGRMTGMNLLYLLFWLPAAGWSLLNGLQLMNLASTLPAREVWAALQQALYNYLLILFPLIALTGPFNAAMSDVFRRWARDESFFPLATFRAALRANWRQGLLFGLLDGILPLLIFLSGRFYLALVEQSPVFLIPIILLVAVVALWLMAAPLMPLLIVSYELRFAGVLKNAFLMTLISLPLSLLIRLGTLAVPILAVLSMYFFPGALVYVLAIGSTLYMVFLLSFNKLVWASYANALGEKYLNANIPGARTGIGLRPKEE